MLFYLRGNYMKPIKFQIKLRKGERPDISVMTIKKLVAEDNYVNPSLQRTLKLLKKTRTPYIRLPEVKEMVLDLDNYTYFERSLKPEATAWVKWELCEEEIEDYEKDKEGYVARVSDMYSKYLKSDFYNHEVIAADELVTIYKITEHKRKGKKINPTKGVKVKRLKV
jgi:hypothetical protein